MKRRGYMLLLAIVLVGVIGMTIAMLNTRFLAEIKAVKSTATRVRLHQLVADARHWIRNHTERCSGLAEGDTIELTTELTTGLEGHLTLTAGPQPDIIVITARIEKGGRSAMLKFEQELSRELTSLGW